mmetsp:Transcript_21801/g.31736  ORF Transcript_21801/g.31736 Transcript_21801/m.31736 type:complete len:1197 (+) Transcript_21801:89-3679(+)
MPGSDSDVVESFDDEHEAFAASRSSQFVYTPTRDYFFSTLDQHADTLEGDVKPPLVVLGPEGSGKSAFLANWVAKRRIIKHRDEFLFQHFVGCSANNCQLAHTLFRLETALKDFFQLREMDVPDSEERLRWSLNRFLGAAAKKHSPARIVIVIDGVNNLKGEGGRDGELYWLPTELPPCVRFIVSSVEVEREQKGNEEVAHHRTYIELARRQCPMLRMEPLSVSIRQTIVSTYCSLHRSENFAVHEQQEFKIVTGNAAAQPLYLRSLLQALRLGVQMTNLTIDDLLDDYMKCTTAFELIEHCLNICSRPFFNDELDNIFSDLVGKMMAVLYVSRNGLSLDELWGVIKMVSPKQNELQHVDKLYIILKDFTMVVSGLHSFSHAIYHEVVYEKYINSSDSLVRWHVLMARFFNQLPPCDRKLECLPYHLEVAGSWNKVKNCLTEIDMFELWWTPKFKVDFIKLWASLTTRKPNPDNLLGVGCGSAVASSKHRPTYDIVEEYVKSLDEYIAAKKPTDEKVAETILQIADFLIEFATNGNELNADVPALIHPPIPSEDLCSLGVPHIVKDDEAGRSTLLVPVMGGKQEDGLKALSDAPLKQPNEDFPECTTYYFHRWMWIQFPLIALGNCGKRYQTGIKVKQKKDYEGTNSTTNGKKHSFDETAAVNAIMRRLPSRSMPSRTFSSASYKLPELKFIRKAAKTTRRVANPDDELEKNTAAAGDAVSKRIDVMNEEIHTLREEYDFFKQQRRVKAKKVIELKAMLKDLKLSESSTEIYEQKLQVAVKNEKKGARKLENSLTFHENMKKLLVMCERHPAHCPALITEIENKLQQDKYLLEEIRSRLWEQKFERQSHNSAFRRMKSLVQEGVDMHTKLLEYRYGMKRHMQMQTSEDAKTLHARSNKQHLQRGNSTKTNNGSKVSSNSVIQMETDTTSNGWDHMWQVISSRTGITDPDIFFQRLHNGGALEEQIKSLKKQSETKLGALKNEVLIVEAELEEVRYEASFVGGQSRDTYQKHKELATVQQKMRRVKERTETTEQLQQQVVAGLNHISDMLGVPERDDKAAIHDIIKDIETVLETLVEEREKQQQGQQTASASVHSDSTGHRGMIARDGVASPETHTRPPELEAVLSKYELPKARLAGTLPSRPVDEGFPTERDAEDDEDDDGVLDRRCAKLQSSNKLRSQQKKAARQNKIDALGSTV